ncbi:MAG: alkyl sulfatase dimerization domain-containing protein [Actinomycetota bacterium]|nr:alkyl sulfatase dimerization domain-containing protein [Actinomycetota bacterium]
MTDTSHLPRTTPNDATAHTRAANAQGIPPFDPADFDRAERGLVAQHPTGVIEGPFGAAWNTAKYDFIQRGAPNPETVHPSLWRQAQLNNIHGLFEVAPGCWQARGYDISNITFIAGDTGWVIVDPLTTTVTAAACLELANEQLGARPVTAVIYTHSHLDHFGGVLGVTTQEDVDAGRCQVIAPEHFMREAVAENLLAGFGMNRRSLYQFGPLLPPGPRGHVDCGLGKAIPLAGVGLIVPTIDITYTGQELVVDGVRIVFQLTPETEAPAEMNFFFPDHGWLCMAENCSHNMHNLIPIRGAQARNSLAWSTYIDDAIELFGDRTEVMFASHHWPRWGTDDVREFLCRQRDLYRWIHDQTLRLANHGYVATEIAEMLQPPPEHYEQSHTVGYYGSLVHNVKAVYQRYLSWYDGNPCHLHPHPPVEAGTRYVQLAGGADALLAAARTAFDAGDYRWVAELVNHLVFAEPTNTAARALQADALEQLGYQSESATFRNAYLMGAQELRHGYPPRLPAGNRGIVRALPIDQLLAVTAMRLKAEEVGGVAITVNLMFTDIDEQWVLGLSNRALHYRPSRQSPDAHVTITTTREAFSAVVAGERTLDAVVASGELSGEGDLGALRVIVEHLDHFSSGFPIVEP